MVAAPLLAVLLVQAAPPAAARPAAPPARPAAGKADPYTRVQQAKAAYEAGQFARCLQIVDGLLKEYPRSPSSHLLRGMALDELGRLDEAARSYRAALAAAPDDPQILRRYGMHLIRGAAWADAIAPLEKSASLAPEAETFFYLGQAHSHTEQGKGKGLKALEKAAELAPSNPTILVKLGEYRAQASQYSPALETLRRARQIAPDEPGLDLALGITQLALLDVDGARASLERVAKKEPDNPAVLASLADACAKARDHAAARTYYQRLVDLGQDDAKSFSGLGAALLGSGDTAGAVAALEKAVAKDPRLPEAHFHLARAYRGASRAEDSQRELRTFQALKANPLQPVEQRTDLEKSLWKKAEALVRDGREAEALKLLAAGNSPENQPDYLVGALYYSLGRHADAERLLKKAVAAAPTLPKVRSYLGLCSLEQGRLDEAQALVDEDLAKNPREPFVLMAKGQVHLRRREWKDAARYLQESKVVEPAILVMLCEAQLESGQAAEARETAQLATTFGASRPEIVEAVKKLLARHQVALDGSPSS